MEDHDNIGVDSELEISSRCEALLTEAFYLAPGPCVPGSIGEAIMQALGKLRAYSIQVSEERMGRYNKLQRFLSDTHMEVLGVRPEDVFATDLLDSEPPEDHLRQPDVQEDFMEPVHDTPPPQTENIAPEVSEIVAATQAAWDTKTGGGLLARAELSQAYCRQHKEKAPAWVWATLKIGEATDKAAVERLVRWADKQAQAGEIPPDVFKEVAEYGEQRMTALSV